MNWIQSKLVVLAGFTALASIVLFVMLLLTQCAPAGPPVGPGIELNSTTPENLPEMECTPVARVKLETAVRILYDCKGADRHCVAVGTSHDITGLDCSDF